MTLYFYISYRMSANMDPNDSKILDDDSTIDVLSSVNNNTDYITKLEQSCKKISITPVQAYMMYGGNIMKDYLDVEHYISHKITSSSPDEIEKLIKVIQSQHKFEEDATKVLIKIRKGMQEHEIKAYIKEIDLCLKTKPNVVDVLCPDWQQHNLHYSMIPACKKLLQKYCDIGLLGCLAYYEYHALMRDLYCSAYMKGKMVNDKVVFQPIDMADFTNKITLSTKNYAALVGIK